MPTDDQDFEAEREAVAAWVARYNRQVYVDSLEAVEPFEVDEHRLWTQFDDGQGSCWVTNGVIPETAAIGTINVTGYHVTEAPWKDGEEWMLLTDTDVACDECNGSGGDCGACGGSGIIWVEFDSDLPDDVSVLSKYAVRHSQLSGRKGWALSTRSVAPCVERSAPRIRTWT